MQKIVFVILHYLAIEETVNCFNSILSNVDYGNHNIIVVNNGSKTQEDSARLKQLCNGAEIAEYIELATNIGFSKGNNAGFELAKRKYNADFIVLLNNDTLINQPDFCQVICKKYEQHHFAALGPKVICKDGSTDSNPQTAGEYILYKQVLAGIIITIKYLLTFLNLVFDVHSKNGAVHECKLQTSGDVKECKLHGCCLIFSKLYIDKFNGLNPDTFLYLEEDILYVRLRNNNLLPLFTPELEIYHEEDAATDMVVTSPIKKRRFIYKNHIKSYRVLIKEITRKAML
ncbi:MAG: glycosyltransferase [Desulfosporosinus sp.]|nr:glycosyltransferase [Desulfosporosinus sp.]